jgi:hypothetical protein
MKARKPISKASPRTGSCTRAIATRLDEVGRQVDRLDAARSEPTGFVQQTGLLNLYTPAMRVDFSGLARAMEAMSELTGDFTATVRAWVERVSASVRQASEAVRGGVRKVRVAVRAATRVIR